MSRFTAKTEYEPKKLNNHFEVFENKLGKGPEV